MRVPGPSRGGAMKGPAGAPEDGWSSVGPEEIEGSGLVIVCSCGRERFAGPPSLQRTGFSVMPPPESSRSSLARAAIRRPPPKIPQNLNIRPRRKPGPGGFPVLPKPPPREGTLGFLYLPPYRVQGLSVAGEETCI